MIPRSGAAANLEAFRALTATFLRRFFDNEITGGSQDLKSTFFWLIGFLAGPLALMPVAFMMSYRLIVIRLGPDALRILSRPDKTLAITLGMIAAGLLASIVWSSLMLERRDGLILGTLPVAGRMVVLSKLAALGAYVFGLSAAMHFVSSLIFGLVLGDHAPSARFVVMSPVAHFAATVGSCAFVFFCVTAAQGFTLAVFGPVGFRRISPLLHAALVASLIVGMTEMPSVIGQVDAFNRLGAPVEPNPAIFWMPPVWFLGLYEWMLGASGPVFTRLAAIGAVAFSLVLAVTLASYLLVYRRVMVRVVETPETGGSLRVSAVFEWFTRGLSTTPECRAASQFLFTSLGRVERLRFVVAVMIGMVAAWIVPAMIVIAAHRETPAQPTTTFALSYATLLLVLVGLRIAISMPADLRAAWIASVIDAPRRRLRSGVWRALFVLSVVPVTASFALLHVSLWGWSGAGLHAGVMLAVGVMLVEIALWHFDDMSGQTPWRPEQANIRAWWPAYLVGFSTITGTVPRLEILAGESLVGSVALVAGPLVIAALVRLAHRRPYPTPPTDVELLVEVPSVLRLE